MLNELHVKNLALIREAELSFSEGFHVLTGETGAGKSLLLGSVSLALGGKGSADLIGSGDDYALSELIFSLEEDTIERLAVYDLPGIEDGELILQRRLQGGKSTCRINGETIPVSKIKELAEILIDIHGQHDSQSLLKKANHKAMLDEYAGGELKAIMTELANVYKEYVRAKDELENQSMDEAQRLREISFLEHEVNEIDSARLKVGEDDELELKYKKMSNARKIMEAVGVAATCLGLDGSVSGTDASEEIGRALREIRYAATFDDELSGVEASLVDIEGLLDDVKRSISDYIDSMSFDDEEFVQVEDRLNLVNQLKSRYGNTIEAVLEHLDKQQAELIKYNDYDRFILGLRENTARLQNRLDELCKLASECRSRHAKRLEKELEASLLELGFKEVSFEVKIERLNDYSRDGYDDVEFMISLNPGEEPRQLAKVASGGELSRIMLALRTIGASKDGIRTLIFDEIDAGISGRTAALVAKKLSELSRDCQVICITHLPQIAAYADHHYLIEKSFEEDRTLTSIREINEDETIDELTRLLGDTASARETAKELRAAALKQ